MSALDRKLAACRALFDSPVPGEAAAARAAYARLLTKAGRREPPVRDAILSAFDQAIAWLGVEHGYLVAERGSGAAVIYDRGGRKVGKGMSRADVVAFAFQRGWAGAEGGL